MKHIRLTILASENKDLNYNIYRSDNSAAVPADISVLQNLQPVMVVNEAESTIIKSNVV
ncbi:MAG: hypothetical protein GX928_05545, partial [Ruminococcaceae bacterium]|nr:hypothetical protein [Oscillospiraceae bacterium]